MLDYTGHKTGRHRSLPVMCAERDGELVVFAGQPQEKRWWRNFRGGAPVGIVLRGHTLEGRGEATTDDSDARAAAWNLYAAKFPKAAADGAVLVRITLRKGGESTS